MHWRNSTPQLLPKVPQPSDMIPEMLRIIAASRAVFDTVVQSIVPSTACFMNVVEPIINSHQRSMNEKSMISILSTWSPDNNVQNVATEAEKL